MMKLLREEMVSVETMTAEQALEAAKGLTFEKVWAALMETQRKMDESQQRIEKNIMESRQQLAEYQMETQKKMDESQRRIDKTIADLSKTVAGQSKNIGGLGHSLGQLIEDMFSTGLYEKFKEFGYAFIKQGPRMQFIENGQIIAEADYFLENGEYVMPVEIKTNLTVDDVDEHLERIMKIRLHMNARGDKRKLVGAVAGGIVSENVLKYAQKKGLFVLAQNGDSVAVVAVPQGFKAREW